VACQGGSIERGHLPPHLAGPPAAPPGSAPSAESLDDLKKQRLLKALHETGGNQSEAARRLGISRTSVWNQMKRFQLDATPGDRK
jgi:two-component system response regulator HydG